MKTTSLSFIVALGEAITLKCHQLCIADPNLSTLQAP